MYELFQTNIGSRGSLAEVWIDRSAGLCKKIYKPDGITITGKQPLHTDPAHIRRLFDNEIRWSTQLQSDSVIKLYDKGELPDGSGLYLIQEYVGPDLLHMIQHGDALLDIIPDAIDQMVKMFELFKAHNVYKRNNAMCNLTVSNGKIKAFDFKYAIVREPEHRNDELHSIDTWLSKIDPTLCQLLRSYV